MKTTNLEKLLKGIGWQGGTIYQVSEELAKYCSPELCQVRNLLGMNDNAIKVIIALYKSRKQAV